MSVALAKKYLDQFGLGDKIITFSTSSATVELAAQAAGCEPARIAKTLSFMTKEGPILIVTAGDTKSTIASTKLSSVAKPKCSVLLK
jgi:prolyl-tRNA editing enzyme YbaK/EbsC (Cys-tRNA(Pro) deacylase)